MHFNEGKICNFVKNEQVLDTYIRMGQQPIAWRGMPAVRPYITAKNVYVYRTRRESTLGISYKNVHTIRYDYET